MIFSARVLLPLGLLLAAGGGLAAAQTAVPAVPPGDQPARPPVPRHPAGGETPVVPPRGPLHPRKPAAADRPASPVVPTQPQAETAAPSVAKPAEAEAARLPRFASLRSDDVNMRAGPGTRYRIEWVYKRRELPVEIEREFDNWRWVRDADGIQGWVNQATLMGRRSFLVQKADATLRAAANDQAPAVALLKAGVIGRIRSCETASDWCSVQSGSYRGYLRRDQFWGTLPGEPINP